MHVRVRLLGKPDVIVVVESKLTKIEKFRRILKEKFDVEPKLQRLFYGGKLLEDGYTFHDYNIKLNDVIQLMVRTPPLQPTDTVQTEETTPETQNKEEEVSKIVYKDAKSNLYAIGDLIDMKDREQGAWFEGKIVRIVNDPDTAQTDLDESITSTHSSEEIEKPSEIENDVENKPPADDKTKKSSLLKYFTKGQKKKKKDKETNCDNTTDTNLLYVVLLDGEDDSEVYCKLKEIRPRARTMIDVEKLKVGQMVMINYNVDDPHERGYWFDFKVEEIKKQRTSHELVGTLYLGPDAIPQNDTRLKLLDKIFTIEEVIPIHQRTDEYKKILDAPPEKRAAPLNCLKCRDNEEIGCKQCGCYVCAGKENPEKIVLCDECNMGYHMGCLSPPLEALPDDDWYCPGCRRDASIVVAPGAARQQRKADTRGTKDWGRGMACVGKTKTCAMPANHFGPIPGIEVGMCWRFRIQLSESGVHRPPVSGIHGRDVEGAYSIVLSGGYEDDYDDGVEFTYTGSGGRDLSGNKRTAGQSCDQTLTRENKALARNCAAGAVSEAGGDASEKWREGRPVRVVRSYKMKKHFPQYAPEEGIRYDGIYKVVKYYPERGLAGYTVWKYLLRRDDPNPAPWEEGAKKFPIVYPDGYLEAEAEKKAQKEKNGKNKPTKGAKTKKRALQEANRASDSEEEKSPPSKKHKANVEVKKRGRPSKSKSPKNSPKTKSPKTPKCKSIAAMFETSASKRRGEKVETTALTGEESEAIEADDVNRRRWVECRELSANGGRKEFLEQVSEVFLCIICQEIVVGPVTTPCLHNFCMGCLKRALNHAGSGAACPCCRRALPDYRPERNEKLQHALRTLMPGYDVGRV